MNTRWMEWKRKPRFMRKVKQPSWFWLVFAKTQKELISSSSLHSSVEIYPRILRSRCFKSKTRLGAAQIESMCKGLDHQIGGRQKVLKPRHDKLRCTQPTIMWENIGSRWSPHDLWLIKKQCGQSCKIWIVIKHFCKNKCSGLWW